MKVIHLNCQGNRGGAGRAVMRIHKSLVEEGVDSRVWIEDSFSGGWRVSGPRTKFQKIVTFIRARVNRFYRLFFRSENIVMHSPALLSSRWVKLINESDADIVNLHWIGGEMMSIADVSRIKKPIVWTLHDMWGFCGAEHVSYDDRWKVGYLSNNRPKNESGFDINRWTWNRKIKHWKNPIHLITPSSWLSSCANQSLIMHDWPSTIIPNPLNVNLWQPYEKGLTRKMFSFTDDSILIGFGGGEAPNKGFDLLLDAMVLLSRETNLKLKLIVYGQYEKIDSPRYSFPIQYMGVLQDDLSLCMLCNALDIIAVPSRNDNLPNIAVEAISCGTPIVAFKIGGLPDIVKHKETGYLAEPFSINDFAKGLEWTISQDTAAIRKKNYSRFVNKFSSTVVANKYIEIYQKIIKLNSRE
jgi:glycosyltransferase involved in cell wall biosynthesis